MNKARVDFCNSNEDDPVIIRGILRDCNIIPTRVITNSSLKKFREKYNIPKGKRLYFYAPRIDVFNDDCQPESNDCITFKKMSKPHHPFGEVFVLDKEIQNWK